MLTYLKSDTSLLEHFTGSMLRVGPTVPRQRISDIVAEVLKVKERV